MSFSDYLEDAVLDHVFRNTALTSPTTVYVALYTATPSDAGGGTEVSGGSYARTAGTFGAASGGAIANSSAVTFPQASGSWGTVTHFGIFDAQTDGNLLAWAALDTGKAIGADDTAEFAIGDLEITLD